MGTDTRTGALGSGNDQARLFVFGAAQRRPLVPAGKQRIQPFIKPRNGTRRVFIFNVFEQMKEGQRL